MEYGTRGWWKHLWIAARWMYRSKSKQLEQEVDEGPEGFSKVNYRKRKIVFDETVRSVRRATTRRLLIGEGLEGRQLLAVDLVSTIDPSLVSITGNGESAQVSISADGTKVAFTSFASNLHSNDSNGISDIYLTSLQSPPVALESFATTLEDTTKTFAVSDFQFQDVENDALSSITISSLNMAPGDSLTVDLGSGAVPVIAGVTITATQIATLTYSPAANAFGASRSTFDFKVNDSNGGFVAAAMQIDVTPVNDPPQITSASSVSVPENSLAVLTLNATDIENDFIAWTIDSGSSLFTIVSGNELQFIAPPDFESAPGPFEVTLRATDNGSPNAFSTHTISVTITDVDEIAPKVTATSFSEHGVSISGINTIAVTFDEPVLNATDPANYELRKAGADGLLLASDTPTNPISATFNGKAYILTFDSALGLQEDTYRLTILDSITDTSGNPLHGGNNGTATGNWTRDFVVVDSDVQRASTSSNGTEGNNYSVDTAISGNGRYIAFMSLASNLVAGDQNGLWDVFRKDTWTGEIVRVSTDSSGVEANGDSNRPAISADGRYVAFDSVATNLVANDNNGAPDVFVKDLVTGELRLVSTNRLGVGGNADSYNPSISADGETIAFEGYATNLVDDPDTNSATDVFVKNWRTGTIVRASDGVTNTLGSGISHTPAISGDGTHVAYFSDTLNASGLFDVYLTEILTDSISGTLTRGVTQLVSTTSAGVRGNDASYDPAVSADGSIVFFYSFASNLGDDANGSSPDIFKKNILTGELEIVSTSSFNNVSAGATTSPSTDASGRFVVFYSTATTLTEGDNNNRDDVFVKDTWTGQIALVSSQSFTIQGDHVSVLPAISADGRFITFFSVAGNLLAGGGDNNGLHDIFVVGNPLAGVSNSVTLAGPISTSLEIDQRFQSVGQLIEGTNNAFDGLNRLQVGNTFYQAGSLPERTNSGRTIVMPSIAIDGVGVHREVTVPAVGGQDFVRTIEVFHNLTSEPLTQTVRLFGNLGSNEQTTVFATSDGDLIVEPTDTWFATDDADPNGGTPAIVHLLHSDYALAAQPSSVSVTEDNVEWSFDITLQAGEVARLASFTITGATRQAALDAVAALITSNSFDGQASTFLSIAELLTIRNFQFAQAPTDIQLSNSSILENSVDGATIGQFTTIDANTPYGDTFVYTLTSGTGDQDNAVFDIIGSQLRVRESLDFESKSSYSIRVRSADDAGLFIEKSFTISVTDLDEIIPTIISTSFLTTGYALTGDTSLTVTFSERLTNGSDVTNYELRAAGADGLLLQSDAVVNPTSVTWSGNTATLNFAIGLVKDTYRLTLRDALADDAGNAIDGNEDTLAGGDWRRDFVVLANAAATVTLVSADSAGAVANVDSERPSISANGRFIAFTSPASNLVAGDTNFSPDIFVKDTELGNLIRVSTDSAGNQSNDSSDQPSISADGRYVAFSSFASNLGGGFDSNSHIFVKDMLTGSIIHVSSNSSGFVNGDSFDPAISGDGRYVVFVSESSNLVPGDTVFGGVFIRNILTGVTQRVSRAGYSPSISNDGRYVAFYSFQNNLVGGDTNQAADVFVKDMLTGVMNRVSTSNSGQEANSDSLYPSISPDGRYLVFSSYANNLVADDTNEGYDFFVKDLATGVVTRIPTNGLEEDASISEGGRYVAFSTYASDLISGDTNGLKDIFVKDMLTGVISRISTNSAGTEANGYSDQPVISADGRYVSFLSYASNLVEENTGLDGQVFRVANFRDITNSVRAEMVGPDDAIIHIDPRSTNAGQLVHGSNNAFDGLNRLRVDDVNFVSVTESTLDDGNRTVVTDTSNMSGLAVHREITVPAIGSQDFARTIDVFTNSSTAAITVPVRLFGNLGSDDHTTVFATSDGDSIVEPTDTWFATDDSDPNGGTPAIVHWLRGENGLNLVPTNVAVTEDNVDWSFSLTVPAGATRRLATFTVLGNTRQQAIDAVNVLQGSNSFAGQAAAFLTADELNSLANFQFDHAPTDIQLSTASIAENSASNTIIGSLSTIDPNGPFGDTFTYSLVSGLGDMDNAAFILVGNELQSNASFDFESKPTYSIRIRSTDASGLSIEKPFTIVVTDRDEISPRVGTTSFSDYGVSIAGINSFAVTFDELVLNATDPLNYELRRAGADGLLLTSDGPIHPVDVIFNGKAHVLKFDSALGLQEDTYRLTILDNITDTNGNRLDGDNNGTATGNWSRDFVVVDSGVSLVSSSIAGAQGNGSSNDLRVSENGRFVVFTSNSDNLVPGDFNGLYDIFKKDLETGEITIVSTDVNGNPANSHSQHPAISADGRYIAFLSIASNLVPGGDNGIYDIYLKDTQTGFITRISANSFGEEANSYSLIPSISADGKLVAFMSSASNLVGDSDTLGYQDIFVKNWETGSIVRVSNSISGGPANGGSSNPKISSDGHRIVFPSQASDLLSGDTNGQSDIFAAAINWDSAGLLSVGSIQRVSVSTSGTEANGGSVLANISPDGRFVDFSSYASNLAVDPFGAGTLDVFRKDLLTGDIQLVSSDSYGNPGNGDSGLQFGTAHSRYAVFYSTADSLVENDTNARNDVFVKDTWTGLIARVSMQGFTFQGNGHSEEANISADGSTIFFWSLSDNLLAGGTGDTNGTFDVFSVPNPLSGASTSRTLIGPSGLSFEIDQRFQSVGQLIEGTNNAFDGLNRLQVGNTFYQVGSLPERTNSGRTIVMPSIAIDGVGVHREVTVPAVGGQDFVRTIEVFRNLTSEPLTQTVRLFGNLGSDAQTTVFATSDGDLFVEPSDSWFATDDSDPDGGTPAVVHLIHSIYALTAIPTSVGVTEDNVEWSYQLTLGVGEVARLGTFTILGATRLQAMASIDALISTSGFGGEAAAFLSGTELASLRNFRFSQAPTDIQLSNSSIAENNPSSVAIGTFSTVDSDAAWGDTFSYSLVSGTEYPDNASFEIVGDELRSLVPFDYETKSSYSIRVRSVDAAGLAIEKTFSISVADIDEIAPTILSTSFLSSGYEVSGTSTLTVTFSEPLANGSDVTNYELQAAGSDGLLLQSDTAINPVSIAWSGNTATLVFASTLAKDTYRLTLRDTLVDTAGNAFDGNGDALTGGDWRRDFVVLGSTRQPIQVVSSGSDGDFGNASSFNNSNSRRVSVNGRFVAFASDASNLTLNDTNASSDVFIKDTWTDVLKLISSSSDSLPGNLGSFSPAITDDGRYVAFSSQASNLLLGDTNNTYDVFVKDTLTNTLTLVSSAGNGSIGNGVSLNPSISGDGRYVTFESSASNLVPADDNGLTDVFLKDILTGSVTLISQSPDSGTLANGRSRFPVISNDGKYVTFYSEASNLVIGDNNPNGDIFLKNTLTGTVTLISTSSNGLQSNNLSISPSISADGRYVAFYSTANNLVDWDGNGIGDVFLKDTLTGTTSMVSVSQAGLQGNGGPQSSFTTSISANGRYVAFLSFANNLVPNNHSNNLVGAIFVKDTVSGEIDLVPTSNSGEYGNGFSNSPSLSADGRYIAFYSFASNLVTGDNNGAPDAFITSNPLSTFETDVSFLTAPSGLSFDYSASGASAGMLVHGTNNSFDGLNRLRVDALDYSPVNPSIPIYNDQGYQFGMSVIAGLGVQRTVTVPNTGSQDFARTIDVFTNSSSAAITVPVRLFGNLGSDDHTTVFATSDGDLIVEPTDTWFATDDSDPNGGTPAIVHLIRNGLGIEPTQIAVTEDNVDWTYSLTVAPGETKRVATFTVLGQSRQQVIDAVNSLLTPAGFGGEAAAFLTQNELSSIVNFKPIATPTIAVTSGNAIYNNAPYVATASISGNNLPVPSLSFEFYSDPDGLDVIPTPENVGTYYVRANSIANDGNTTAQSSIASFQITPLAIIGEITVADKIFDGTTTATILTRTLTGVLGTDDVTYVGGMATFDTATVGSVKNVMASGLNLSGPDAGNYTVNETAITTANIVSPGAVVNTQLFYRAIGTNAAIGNSNNPTNRIDSSKIALLPGQAESSIENGAGGTAEFLKYYSGFIAGINGLVVDFANSIGVPTGSDFQFRTWNGIDGSPETSFVPTTATPIVTNLGSVGVGGSRRMKIEFSDNAIKNTWLQVTVLANPATTGLVAPYVFYFGNAAGDVGVGNGQTVATGGFWQVTVTGSDGSAVLGNQTAPGRADITNTFDVGKNLGVSGTDRSQILSQAQGAVLRFFDVPSSPASLTRSNSIAPSSLAPIITSSKSLTKRFATIDQIFKELGES